MYSTISGFAVESTNNPFMTDSCQFKTTIASHLQHDRLNDGDLVDVRAEDVVLDGEENLKSTKGDF